MAHTIVRIAHPRQPTPNDRAIMQATRFFATGTVEGPLTTLRVELVDLSTTPNIVRDFDPQSPYPDPRPVLRVVDFRQIDPQKRPHLYRWTVLVKFNLNNALADLDYNLVVTPTLRPGSTRVLHAGTVQLRRRAGVVNYAIPTIQSPGEDDYLIQGDERDSFSVYGATDCPVLSATVGGVEASYVMWVSELGYYCAQFIYLQNTPGPGSYDLVVTNTTGASSPRPVIVDVL